MDATRIQDSCPGGFGPGSVEFVQTGAKGSELKRLASAVVKCRNDRFARRNLVRLQVPSATHVSGEPTFARHVLGERYASRRFAGPNNRTAGVKFCLCEAPGRACSGLFALRTRAVVAADALDSRPSWRPAQHVGRLELQSGWALPAHARSPSPLRLFREQSIRTSTGLARRLKTARRHTGCFLRNGQSASH